MSFANVLLLQSEAVLPAFLTIFFLFLTWKVVESRRWR